jgi:dolichol-phosphate mannosyltransferase
MDISVVIPTYNEAANIGGLLIELKKVLQGIGGAFELIVVDGHSSDATRENAQANGAKVLLQQGPGYAAALHEGLNAAQGDYVVTMDADFSHAPDFINTMWEKRDQAEVIIASRFVAGGDFEEKGFRSFLSLLLNKVSVRILDLPINDISSGFRMYHRRTFQGLVLKSTNYDILEEIIIRILCQGYKILEVPLHYQTRKSGTSKARLVKFAQSYTKTILRMWKLRNSIACADYDNRAYNSRIFLQRYWQRKRHQIIMDMLGPKQGRGRILDAGCSASKIIQDLPEATGLDIMPNKLRFLRSTNSRLIQGSILRLPFKDGAFQTIICSQVIEHLAGRDHILNELTRVLGRGGIFIIGTPDYDSLSWRTIGFIYEHFIPTAYGEEHVTHYTLSSLSAELRKYGYKILEHRYVLGGELIVKAEKG